MGKYMKWFYVALASIAIIATVITLTVMYSGFAKDRANNCITPMDFREERCQHDPTWYYTDYKPWEDNSSKWIEKNVILKVWPN